MKVIRLSLCEVLYSIYSDVIVIRLSHRCLQRFFRSSSNNYQRQVFFNAHYFVCNGLKINLKRRHFKLSDNFLKFFKGRSCIVMKRLLDRYPFLNWGRRATFARSPLRMISSGFFCWHLFML